MSRTAADALMSIFGLVAVEETPQPDGSVVVGYAPAEAACSCGSRHVGTVATAREFQQEHEGCRRTR